MNVQEMLESVGFDDIWVYIMAEYCRERTPDEAGRAYVNLKKMYGDLLSRTPEDNDDNSVLMVMKYANSNDLGLDIAYYRGSDGQTFFLTPFISWNRILGFEMLELSIDEYGLARTAAQFLWVLASEGTDEAALIKMNKELEESLSSISGDLELLEEPDDFCMSLFGGNKSVFADKGDEKIFERFEAAAKEQLKSRL